MRGYTLLAETLIERRLEIDGCPVDDTLKPLVSVCLGAVAQQQFVDVGKTRRLVSRSVDLPRVCGVVKFDHEYFAGHGIERVGTVDNGVLVLLRLDGRQLDGCTGN